MGQAYSFNLLAIRKVASIMEPTSLAEDGKFLLDIQNSLKDPSFVEMCFALKETYQKFYGLCCHNHENGEALQNALKHHDFINVLGSVVSSSSSLITLIECVLKSFTHLLDNLLVDELREAKLASS